MNKRFTTVLASLFNFCSPFFSQVKNKTSKETNKKGNKIPIKSVRKVNKTSKNVSDRKDPVFTVNSTTPGVYVHESAGFPPVVTQVATAIPAFIGYTEKGTAEPTEIRSMAEYKNVFGGPYNEIGEFEIDNERNITSPTIFNSPKYRMYYMLKMFYENGGGDCFIISVGHYSDDNYAIKNDDMLDGLTLLNHEELPTLILFPDATSSENRDDPADLYKAALAQCAAKRDRFLICDVEEIDNDISRSAEQFRNAIGSNNLKFGAAYFPSLQTSLNYGDAEDQIKVKLTASGRTVVLKHTDNSISDDPLKIEESLYHTENEMYRNLYQEINTIIYSKNLILPPSAAIAGIYARVDATSGVWKAPANVSLNAVLAPTIEIDANKQRNLNVSNTGKSINAIRAFSGRGVLVWGARTLDGNDNEWRYIQVRRLSIMIEKSTKNAIKDFVNEPNDANTWMKVSTMIENYLTTLWREGGLQGSKPEHAFYVAVGLNKTMTTQDMMDGKIIVEIGMAALRPAEFTILKISQELTNNN